MGAMAIADLVKTTLGPKGMVRHMHVIMCCACDSAKGCGGWVAAAQALSWYTLLQDKILQSMTGGKEIMVTNDGATILKSLYVDNPAAKVLVGESRRLADQGPSVSEA